MKYVIQRLKSVRMRHFVPDLFVIVASLYASLYLRVGAEGFADHIETFSYYLPLIVAIRIAVLFAFDIYSILWRYISAGDAFRLAKAVIVSSTIIIAISFFISWEFGRLPRSVYLIDTILVLVGLMGNRLLRRVHHEKQAAKAVREGKKTIIFGAGENGRMLAQRFASDPGQLINVVCFVDDDPKKNGLSIADVKVLGSRDRLSALIRKYGVQQVIIGVNELPGEIIRDIVQITRKHNIKPRICTSWKARDGQPENFVDREVNLSDLLNRAPRKVDTKALESLVRGKRVLVTGAGGSIGSEIARQVMEQQPGRLILLDHSEFNLYQIDRELRLSTDNTDQVVPLLLDIKDHQAVANRFEELSPDVVFHAAAYKHVHLVEANPFAAILNNVGGTLNVLNACREVGVTNFVNVSTDKAVNPAGVMGATKRVSELLVTAAAKATGNSYCSVRFGNVLGSSGSLIPLLQEQIRNGGPVTVTHKDMTRYFMTIPEAVSLVLQAATIARPGDINVLKMGDPVKILDIARSMIALMGKTEDQVPVMFTGLRPGEKIYEELYIRGDELKTENPDILTLPDGDTDFEMVLKNPNEIFNRTGEMVEAAHLSDRECMVELNNLVKSTYVPPDEIKEESEKVNHLIRPNQKLH